MNFFTTPASQMSTNIATALATTYQHHDLQIPPLPPFRKVNRIAIQTESTLDPWSFGTIDMLTTLHLTLGHILPENINTASISRRQYLILHQSLLHWLILGTSPNLWTLNYISTSIIRGALMHINEHYAACGLMQALSLPRGRSTTPNHQHNKTILLTQHHYIHQQYLLIM
jgi:hypothetical protein